MPMSSAEIAQLNGAFTQASMNRMAYSSAIGQGAVYGGQNGAGADAMMGGMASRASAIGAPIVSGAMGLLGLDPMSLGLKAGIGAFGAGAGLGGAVAAGGAVALPLMAAGAAVNYGAQQMYAGMGQQMDLNQTLRGAYNFRNQYGGTGFGRSDMTAIGGMMRGMTEQFGPGGEITSMGELTQLAGKMSTMGLAQGVRDVKEFTSRFKEMVGTLKTMAKDLGTTLEGAMEFAAAAKQSGVFGMGHTARFTHAIRAASVSGGIAISEATGAASIGSQISRSIGGLGSQGAMAGIRTIGQIGTAQQMGILSEEDIYNATGLTGAEGRQAFAASQMQRAGHWLQSGRGRRLLASIAGKNGTLDESAVQQIMSGGMGIAETMAADRSHTTGPGGIGRANFIRNEGRLRGAAMARFGAFLPAMQLQEWASSKGIDINEMDDRSMLFAQRQLGMGRDEMDAAVRMANNMPQILHQMDLSQRQDQYFQQLAQQRKMQGVSGVKQRYEQARSLVNNKLQKVGQDIFNSGSEAIDEFFNNLMGTYVESASADIDQAMQAVRAGGAAGAATGARVFGLGPQHRNRFVTPLGINLGRNQGMDFDASMRRGVSGTFEQSVTRGFNQGGGFLGGYGTAAGAGAAWVLAGESGVSQMKRAGFDLSGMNSQQMRDKFHSIEMSRLAYQTSGTMRGLGGSGGDISTMYSLQVSGSGDERIVNIQSALERTNPTLAKRLRETHGKEAKLALLGEIERGAGVGEGSSMLANYKAPAGMQGLVEPPGGYASQSAQYEAYAHAMGADHMGKTEAAGRGIGAYIATVGAMAVGGLGGLAASLLPMKKGGGIRSSVVGSAGNAVRNLIGRVTGNYQKTQEAGDFFVGDEFRDLATGMLGSAADRSDTISKLNEAIQANPTSEKAEQMREMLKTTLALDAVDKAGGWNKLSDAQKKDLASKGVNLHDAAVFAGKAASLLDEEQQRDLREARHRAQQAAGDDVKTLGALGVYDAANGTLSSATLSRLSPSAQAYVSMATRLTVQESQGTFGGDKTADYEMLSQRRAGLSDAELQKISAATSGTQEGEQAAYALGLRKRLERARGSKSGIAAALGGGISRSDLAAMGDLSGSGAAQLLARFGVKDTHLIEELQGAKSIGAKTEALMHIQSSKEYKAHTEKESKEEAEKRDPFGAEQVRYLKEHGKYLELIAKHTGATADEMKYVKTRYNPENKDQK